MKFPLLEPHNRNFRHIAGAFVLFLVLIFEFFLEFTRFLRTNDPRKHKGTFSARREEIVENSFANSFWVWAPYTYAYILELTNISAVPHLIRRVAKEGPIVPRSSEETFMSFRST